MFVLCTIQRKQRLFRTALASISVLLLTIGVNGPHQAYAQAYSVDDGPTQEERVEQRNKQWLSSELETIDPFWKPKWATVAKKSIAFDQVEERKELSNASHKVLQKFQESKGFWENPVVDGYLQQVLLSIHPQTTIPGWGGSLEVHVLQSSLPNAMALYNGTIIVSTGLLAELRSRDELAAVLAHEVAHLAEDHSYEAYKSSKNREQLAEVLGGIAGVAAGVALGNTASNNGPSGQQAMAITRDVAITTVVLADNIAEAVGAKYDRDQEKQADRLAQKWLLQQSSARKAALVSALTRVEKATVMRGGSAKHTFLSSHPAYGDRLSVLEKTVKKEGGSLSLPESGVIAPDSTYDQKMAPLLELDAGIRISNGRHEEAIALLDRVIDAGYAAPKTYLLKAIALRYAQENSSSNEKVMALLSQYTESGGATSPRYYMEKGLMHLRLEQPNEAAGAFQQCADGLRDAEDPAFVEMREHARSMAMRLETNAQEE